MGNDELEYKDDFGATPDASRFPRPSWTDSTGIGCNAIALSPSALVAVYAKNVDDGDGYSRSKVTLIPEKTDWYLGAFDRSSGDMFWETKLPDIGNGLKGEPLWQGLAIDRNGNIVVMQRNGNVLVYGENPVAVEPTPQQLARSFAKQTRD